MADNRITLILEGLTGDDGHVRLPVFLGALENLYAALLKIDAQANNGQKANTFQIVDLSHSSPARVVIEARPTKKHLRAPMPVVEPFIRYIKAINVGEVPEDVSSDLLENLLHLAEPVGTKLGFLSVQANDETFDFSKEFANRVELALAPQYECVGTVKGTLDAINVHEGVNNFWIYPSVGPKKIKCHFNEHLKEIALGAVTRDVSVTGMLKYRKNIPFPYEIVVTDIDIFPREDELPGFDDLRGLAPDATGDLSSEDFIRLQRDGWE